MDQMRQYLGSGSGGVKMAHIDQTINRTLHVRHLLLKISGEYGGYQKLPFDRLYLYSN